MKLNQIIINDFQTFTVTINIYHIPIYQIILKNFPSLDIYTKQIILNYMLEACIDDINEIYSVDMGDEYYAISAMELYMKLYGLIFKDYKGFGDNSINDIIWKN